MEQKKFLRKARIGLSILNLEEGKTVYVEVKKDYKYSSKNQGEIDAWDVVNLETGEEQTLWVSGGMRGTLSQMKDSILGKRLEVTLTGQKPIEVVNDQGKKETVKVNTYDIFELQ